MVTLFNLQGTRRLSQTALLDYHNSFRLSRTFFKFFQTFSSQSSLFHRFRPPPSRTASLDYHILKPLSRTFFLNSKLFSWLSSVPPSLAGKLAYNIKPFPLCQAFSPFLLKKARKAFCGAPFPELINKKTFVIMERSCGLRLFQPHRYTVDPIRVGHGCTP